VSPVKKLNIFLQQHEAAKTQRLKDSSLTSLVSSLKSSHKIFFILKVNADIFCSVHTQKTHKAHKSAQSCIWGPLWQPPPPSPHRRVPINLRQVRSSHTHTHTHTCTHTHTHCPTPDLSPVTTVTRLQSRNLFYPNLKRQRDDPRVYLAAARQSPIPTVQAVRGTHTHTHAHTHTRTHTRTHTHTHFDYGERGVTPHVGLISWRWSHVSETPPPCFHELHEGPSQRCVCVCVCGPFPSMLSF